MPWRESQSRLTVRGEIFKAATISSSVNPPRGAVRPLWLGEALPERNAVQGVVKSEDGSDSGGNDQDGGSSRFTLDASVPPCLPRTARAETASTGMRPHHLGRECKRTARAPALIGVGHASEAMLEEDLLEPTWWPEGGCCPGLRSSCNSGPPRRWFGITVLSPHGPGLPRLPPHPEAFNSFVDFSRACVLMGRPPPGGLQKIYAKPVAVFGGSPPPVLVEGEQSGQHANHPSKAGAHAGNT